MKQGKLILICGLPGAGKTTLARKLEVDQSAVRFCPDEWMQAMHISLWDGKIRETLEERFWQLGKQLLSLGNTVILEYGFWGKSEREEKLEQAHQLGALVELYFLNIDVAELKRRLRERGMEGDDLIASEKIEEYSRNFERPSNEELALYDNSATIIS